MPPGARTLAISGPATAMSNQCMALPASTASTDASGSGIASALPASGTDIRQDAAQLAQHRRIGLDRGDVGAHRDQRGGQLAGSGAEVEHPRAGRGLKRPAHGGLRVVRAVLGVRGRRRAERGSVPEPFVLFHAISLSTGAKELDEMVLGL